MGKVSRGRLLQKIRGVRGFWSRVGRQAGWEGVIMNWFVCLLISVLGLSNA